MKPQAVGPLFVLVMAFLMGCATPQPLVDAVYYQDYNAMVALMGNGHQDLNVRDKSGRTPLIIAAYYDNLPILEYLMEQGADLNAVDSAGKTAMHYAIQNDAIIILKTLLEKGANPNIQDTEGNTPLMIATMAIENKAEKEKIATIENKAEAVRLLLSHDADATIRNNAGYTPVTYAYQHQFKDIESLFEKK